MRKVRMFLGLTFTIGLLVTGYIRLGFAGDETRSMMVHEQKRTFLLHVPPSYDATKSVPLLLVFHGGRGSGERIAKNTQFSELADREGFIAVYPDGYKGNWNDGRGATKAEKSGVSDVEFVKELIDQLRKDFNIDEGRIYATGISNGGIFSHRLGCELSGLFAAIAAVVGPIAPSVASRCNPIDPISVLGIYGTKDPLIPWEGGEVTRGEGGPVLGVEATMDLWGKLNMCRKHSSREALPEKVKDGTHVWKESYIDCKGGVEVLFYTVEGMGHAWPPQEPPLQRISGPTSRNIDATQIIWNFFKSQSSRNPS